MPGQGNSNMRYQSTVKPSRYSQLRHAVVVSVHRSAHQVNQKEKPMGKINCNRRRRCRHLGCGVGRKRWPNVATRLYRAGKHLADDVQTLSHIWVGLAAPNLAEL